MKLLEENATTYKGGWYIQIPILKESTEFQDFANPRKREWGITTQAEETASAEVCVEKALVIYRINFLDRIFKLGKFRGQSSDSRFFFFFKQRKCPPKSGISVVETSHSECFQGFTTMTEVTLQEDTSAASFQTRRSDIREALMLTHWQRERHGPRKGFRPVLGLTMTLYHLF